MTDFYSKIRKKYLIFDWTTDCASKKYSENDEKNIGKIHKNRFEKLEKRDIYNNVIIW